MNDGAMLPERKRTTTTWISCSWCHESNELTGRPLFCWSCGHRADVARMYCNCVACRHTRQQDEEREREKHDV